jgi:pimeloyl-ACP methyl ester carboxylesterase
MVLINEKRVTILGDIRHIMRIYLIHGFCLNNTIWDLMLPNVQSKNIVKLSLPGYNGTKDLSYNSIFELAKSYEQHITEPGILIGHSMGGYIALELCRLFKEKILGLMLFHSHVFADTPEKVLARKKNIAFIEKNGTSKFCNELINGLFYSKKNKRINELTLHCGKIDPKILINDLDLMISRVDFTEHVKLLNIPVGFIIGSHDEILDKSSWIKQTAYPKLSSITLLKNSAHMGMLEEPKRSANALNNFIDTCSLF